VTAIENLEDEVVVSINRLSKDLRSSAALLDAQEARFLVDSYYEMQANRIRAANQERSVSKAGEPVALLDWLSIQSRVLENQIKGALSVYADAHPIGRWMMSITGIGPVIAAGFLAHVDIARTPTAGSLWRFAGLDPTAEWKKGEKRPHNASLKTLCWKLGESFVKVHNRDDDVYGKLYKDRKELETSRNEAGLLADQAKAKLEKFKIGKSTDAYKAYSVGKLPPAHIHARAKRYAVKMFLSHLQEVWWTHEYNAPPPAPYAMVHAGHAHKIEPPAFGG
jgi:hypothetical protein